MKLSAHTLLFILFSFTIRFVYATDTDSIVEQIIHTTNVPGERIELAKLKLQSIDTNNLKQKGLLHKLIGSSFQIVSQYDSALYYYSISKTLAEQQKDRSLKSALLYNIGTIHRSRGDFQKALKASLEGLEIDKELGNTDNIIASMTAVSTTYKNLHLYDKALNYQLQAVELCEKNNKFNELPNAHFNLANIYVEVGKTEKAMVYYNFANESYDKLLIEDSTNFLNLRGKSEIEYAIGNVHMQKKHYDVALVYFQKSLRIKKKIDDKTGIAKCLIQLGNIYYQQQNFELALTTNFEALQYKLTINDKEGVALLLSNNGRIMLAQGNVMGAENVLKRSILIAREINAFTILKENYFMLSKLFKFNKDLNNALLYKEKYTHMLDTLYQIQGQRAVQEMSIKYETEKTEQENKLLQQQNELQELTIKKQRSINFLLGGIAFLILIIVVFVLYQYRQKKKANELILAKNTQLSEQKSQIEIQKQEIEDKNRDLTDSILYAKRIQEAMLVHPEDILKQLNDYFILFRPKDIVSGDFYWVGEKNGKIIFSAIDCTGHGVPGAFMSMLGDSYLNQIVYNFDITEPDQILNELSRNIRTALNQEETHNQDGMDMVLCTIDLKNSLIEFACAKNPLIYIQNGEVVKVKGENQPIGGGGYDHQPFVKHSLKIDQPTSVYMFSDGYQDQFGGDKNKKFMIKKMQQLMLEVNDLPMNEQKQIFDKRLTEWMGTNEQVDDVVLVGFKVG